MQKDERYLKWIFCFVVYAMILLFNQSLWANYPAALPNANLKNEIKGDNERLIPQMEYFSFAVDGQAYHRFLGNNDFYHGTGYWLQIRSEASLHEYFTANLRTILFSGTSSNGYAEPIGFYNLLGLTGKWPTKVFGGTFSGRVLDLGRQTVGRGLLIQEREFFGGIFIWEKNSHKVFLRGTGTGAIVHDDDTYNLEISFFKDLIGLGALHYGEKDRSGYQFIYSHYHFLDSLSYDFEIGMREKKLGLMAALNFKASSENWIIDSRLEGRSYEDGFGEDLVGQISQDYVSYDQYDKPYTNIMNAFVSDDELTVYALKLNLQYKFNHHWRIHSNNEVGKFDFDKIKDDEFYFYRFGFGYFPLPNREDNLVIFMSNKVLTESYTRPPNLSSKSNTPMFKNLNFLGVEANFRF